MQPGRSALVARSSAWPPPEVMAQAADLVRVTKHGGRALGAFEAWLITHRIKTAGSARVGGRAGDRGRAGAPARARAGAALPLEAEAARTGGQPSR